MRDPGRGPRGSMRSLPARKRRGRPSPDGTYIAIWVLVEAMRDRKGGGERATERGGVRNLVRIQEKLKHLFRSPLETTLGAYKRAKKRRKDSPYFASLADAALEAFRRRRAQRGWHTDPIDLYLDRLNF